MMKRLTMFMAAALVCAMTTMFASETISPSALTAGWGNVTVDKGTITFTGTWSEAAQLWWDGKDCSAYETLRVEFEDAGEMHLLVSVEYNKIASVTEADILDATEKNVITLKLDEEGKSDIQKVMIKSETAGTVKVKAIYLLAAGEKPEVLPTTGCPEGTAVKLPAKDGYPDGNSWSAKWDGETQTITWTFMWGGLYLNMNNDDWSSYKDLYIKFKDDVPAKIIVDVNSNGGNSPIEVAGGNFVIIPIKGNTAVNFSKVECLCFKMAEEGSVTIECMTLRGDGPSPVDPTGCPEGTAVTLPAKDGYKDGESWGATWNGEKQMATWTQAWGGLYLGMNNADWSGYKDLYIKFDGEVPAKLIVDVNGNGNNDPQEISGGDHIIIPIQGNKNVDFSKVECLCFKLAAKDSVKIQCMTLRGGSEEPITGCGGILVNLPEKDGYQSGESWGATWDGATHTATWTDAWGGLYLSMGNADWSAYKSLYIKFAEQVPAKLIIDVNGNGNNYAHEIESGNEILIPIEGASEDAKSNKVECLCFKLAAEGSVTIECISLRSGIGTDTEEVTVAEDNVQKMIENGQLILIRDGVRYNAQGQILK